MKILRPSLVVALLLAAVTLSAADTASFRAQLQSDLRRNLERHHTASAGERAKNTKPSDFYSPFLLSGLINLHAQTGEAALAQGCSGVEPLTHQTPC